VTKENRLRYIDFVAAYKLNAQMDRQCTAFFGACLSSSLNAFKIPTLTLSLILCSSEAQPGCRTSSTPNGSGSLTSASCRCSSAASTWMSVSVCLL
jgi:hypothetical protein